MSLRGPAKLGWACVVDKYPRQILAQQSSWARPKHEDQHGRGLSDM